VQDVIAELVGDLADEFQDQDPLPERLPDGRVRVPGQLPVDELEGLVGVTWPPGAATTVGGRVVEAFARIPAPGERIVIDDITVDVERVEHHAVTSVLVTPPPSA
jgi:putative hemolysin